MSRTMTSALALATLLAVTGCGSQTGGPGDAGTTDDPGRTSEDTGGTEGGQFLLPDTQGDGPFHIDTASVRVAESFPLQLFLDVQGHAPTPCHRVAYEVEHAEGTVLVHLTTVADSEAMCTQVLEPHDLAVPLGPAEDLPVTVDVNDGEHVLTVEG